MILRDIFRSSEASQPQAAITESSELYQELIRQGGYGISNTGKTVTPQTAMRCSAVFACVNVIAQTVAQLPLYLYRREGNRKTHAVDHPLYQLVGNRPNKFHNSFNFREMLTAHQCLRGDSFAFINRIGNGRIYELLPLHPDCVGVNRDPWTWEITYTISQKKGINGVYTPKEVLHVMGMTLNGFKGVTPLTYAREAIGLALATEEHGARLFSNGAQISKVLKHPGKLGDVAYQRMKESLASEFSGVANSNKTMILEEGMGIDSLSMTMEDAQFLETRQYQIPEIARFYRMPLHKIQDLTKATFSNIEHQSMEFLTDTMLPWLTRWEQSLNTQLLTDREQGEYFFKFDLDDLMRADMKSRFEAYSSAITSRIMNPNEAREKEDMNPYVGGDEYINPAITEAAGKESEARAEVEKLFKALADREPPSVIVNQAAITVEPARVDIKNHMPSEFVATKKTVTFERDPETEEIISAQVIEE